MSSLPQLSRMIEAIPALLETSPDDAGKALARACAELEAARTAFSERTALIMLQLRKYRYAPGFDRSIIDMRSGERSFLVRHRDLYRNCALALASCGKLEQAMVMAQTLISACPCLEESRRLLVILAERHPDIRAKALALLWARRLERLPDLGGTGELGYPLGLAWEASGQVLYATDDKTHEVCRFEPGTDSWTRLSGPWDKPKGLAVSEERLLWICDAGTRRIFAVSLDGRIVRVLDVPALLGAQEESNYPEFICALGGQLYLLTCDAGRNRARLWALAPAAPEPRATALPNPPFDTSGSLGTYNGQLLLAGSLPAMLAFVDPGTGRTVSLLKPPCHTLHQAAAMEDGIVATHSEGLLKIDFQGRLLYDIDFIQFLGRPGLGNGLVVGNKDGRATLFLTEFKSARILCFDVEGDSSDQDRSRRV